MVWYSHLFKNFPQFVVIKGFDIVNKAEVDVFLEFSCFFDDPVDVGNLIAGSCSIATAAAAKSLQSCPTLQPHGQQHTRLPCPSPTPGVYSN